jgi:hypothetical protein
VSANEGTCRSCGAQIVWTVTENGKRMPLSKATEQRRYLIDGDVCRSVLVYQSHWADCPSAAQHRSAR